MVLCVCVYVHCQCIHSPPFRKQHIRVAKAQKWPLNFNMFSDFWLLSKISCRWAILRCWMADCNWLFLVLPCSWSSFSASVGLWPFFRDSRHSCSGRSFSLCLALGSLSRGRAKAMYSAADFGLSLSKDYCSMAFANHMGQDSFSRHVALYAKSFSWHISCIDAEEIWGLDPM